MGSERFFQADQFGLGEQRVGGGNRLGRILRRIWHVCGGCEGPIER
jgi:hypothetical protein